MADNKKETKLEQYLRFVGYDARNSVFFEDEYYLWKRSAAAALEISEKSLERKAHAGKLAQIEQDRKIYYKVADLLALENEMSQTIIKPSVQTDRQTTQELAAPIMDLKELASMLLSGVDQIVTNRLQSALPPAPETSKKKEIDISAIKDKQVLNFAESVAYAGIPSEDIKAGIDSGEIQAKKTSKNGVWKIYRLSLDEFIKNYFAPKKKAANRK